MPPRDRTLLQPSFVCTFFILAARHGVDALSPGSLGAAHASSEVQSKVLFQEDAFSSWGVEDSDETPRGGSGNCTADDLAVVKAWGSGSTEGTWPRLMQECSMGSFHLFRGGLDSDGFVECLTRRASISALCGQCFSLSVTYSAQHCKFACLTKWCSPRCVRCSEPAGMAMAQCVGGFVPEPALC
mmetsp:Transcript_90986/g.284621  ORF Transcript_90986/g.284621 Transcript_90986/m.284621 type:complete len:185 (+) Transcript_90986:3-557(+)